MATTADLEPHPLVPQVASGLIALGVPLVDLAKALLEAKFHDAASQGGQVVQGPAAGQYNNELSTLKDELEAGDFRVKPVRATTAKVGYSRERVDNAALALAGATGVPELVTFAGYVGGRFLEQDKEWCVFYLDSRLSSWLLVDTNGIVFRDKRMHDTAPCGQRDVIWVKADAPVGLGNASEAAQAQFLTGQFTSAGDIDAPAGGGTLDAATGVFCEARSVGCCKNNTGSKYCRP
jgi:hypothetical protein